MGTAVAATVVVAACSTDAIPASGAHQDLAVADAAQNDQWVRPTQPTCADGIHNGTESSVDCGGPTCPSCASGQPCTRDADCVSSRCIGGVCGVDHGTIEFALPRTYPAPNQRYAQLVAADINDDRHLDLVVTTADGVQLFPGRGDGTFATSTLIEAGGGWVAVGDFNEDGRADLAYAYGGEAGEIAILPGIR